MAKVLCPIKLRQKTDKMEFYDFGASGMKMNIL